MLTDHALRTETHGSRAWSLDNARALLRSALAEGDPLTVFYSAMLALGLRPREALTLPWAHTDEHSVLLPASRFNPSLVTIPIGRGTAAVLEQHWHSAADGGDLVFTTIRGAPLNLAVVHRHLQRRCKAARIPLGSLIAIRNCVADWLKVLGASDIEVMAILRLGPSRVDFGQLQRTAQMLDDALLAGLRFNILEA